MSILLDRVLAQSVTMSPVTVALSKESVTVLLFATGFLEERLTWLDVSEDPLDQVTDTDWDIIETLVGNMVREIMSPMVGFCFPLVTATVPDNCLLCDGTTYAREDYPTLYSVLDAAFVLDADNFFVPDIRSRIPIGTGQGTGLSEYTTGQTGGEETHQLTEAELASHSHTDAGHTHSYQPPGTTGLAVSPGELPVLLPALLPTITGTGNAAIQPTGSDTPHNNIQPFIALPWAIVAF